MKKLLVFTLTLGVSLSLLGTDPGIAALRGARKISVPLVNAALDQFANNLNKLIEIKGIIERKGQKNLALNQYNYITTRIAEIQQQPAAAPAEASRQAEQAARQRAAQAAAQRAADQAEVRRVADAARVTEEARQKEEQFKKEAEEYASQRDPLTGEELRSKQPAEVIKHNNQWWTKKSLLKSSLYAITPNAHSPLDPFTRQLLPDNIIADLKNHFNIPNQEYTALIANIKRSKRITGDLNIMERPPAWLQQNLDQLNKTINETMRRYGIE